MEGSSRAMIATARPTCNVLQLIFNLHDVPTLIGKLLRITVYGMLPIFFAGGGGGTKRQFNWRLLFLIVVRQRHVGN